MPVEAVKDLGEQVKRTFSDEVWKTGVPQKNGWKKLDYDTTVVAAKLPEQMEIKNRKVETVEVPPMPEVDADEEKEVAEPVAEEKQKAKPGKKKANA